MSEESDLECEQAKGVRNWIDSTKSKSKLQAKLAELIVDRSKGIGAEQ